MDSLFHVVEAQQFNRELLTEIFAVTKEMEEVVSLYGSSILNRRIMADSNESRVRVLGS